MKTEDFLVLTMHLTREVARLHGVVASLQAVVEELRIVDDRLDKIDAAQIQIDELQKFYSWLESINPELAARIDTRSERMFDVSGDPHKKFMDDSTGLDE